MELRETIDLYQRDMEFTKHLDIIISTAVEILSKSKPVFINTSWDYVRTGHYITQAGNSTHLTSYHFPTLYTPTQKFRFLILDILSRMPMHEIMRPHALDVMNLLIHLIRHDNAESVAVCFKLGVDLYRSFKTILEPTVTPFFNTIIEMYDTVPKTCEDLFGDIKVDRTQVDGYPSSPPDLTATTTAEASTPKGAIETAKTNLMRRAASGTPNASGTSGSASSESVPTDVVPGMKSFKALQECPVAVVFLLQTYKAMLQVSLTSSLPTIFKVRILI